MYTKNSIYLIILLAYLHIDNSIKAINTIYEINITNKAINIFSNVSRFHAGFFILHLACSEFFTTFSVHISLIFPSKKTLIISMNC